MLGNHADRGSRLLITTFVALGGLAALFLMPYGSATATTVDTGKIYYSGSGSVREMNPDGTGDKALSSALEWYSEPSISPHDGRWFLQVGEVVGQYYPDGRARLEVFAIHESGTPKIQLTDGKIDGDSFIEPNNREKATDGGQWAEVRWTAN